MHTKNIIKTEKVIYIYIYSMCEMIIYCMYVITTNENKGHGFERQKGVMHGKI